MKIFHKRLSSPFFDDSEYSDNLVNQWDDIQDFCATSLPYTRSTQTFLQSFAPMPTSPPITTVSSSPTAEPTTTCTGQLVQPSSHSECMPLSHEYSVPEGHVAAVIGDPFCDFQNDQPVCLPLPCEIYVVDKFGETW